MAKALGLDLGTRTLGIAVSDSAGWYAYGVENFRFNEGNYKLAVERVVQLAAKDNITELALGLPLNMNGTKGERAESCLRFKEQLLEEIEVLLQLLENSTDEKQQDAIIKMVAQLIKYVNKN